MENSNSNLSEEEEDEVAEVFLEVRRYDEQKMKSFRETALKYGLLDEAAGPKLLGLMERTINKMTSMKQKDGRPTEGEELC